MDLNTDLGRRWLATTLNLVANEAAEAKIHHWIRVHDGQVSIGIGPCPYGEQETSEYIAIGVDMTTAELLTKATKLGSLAAKPVVAVPFSTYPKGPVTLDFEEQVLMKLGKKIHAIKALRQRITSAMKAAGYQPAPGEPEWYGLKDAKDSVEAYVPDVLWYADSDIPKDDPKVLAVLQKHKIVLGAPGLHGWSHAT